jgi:hypothetical protein
MPEGTALDDFGELIDWPKLNPWLEAHAPGSGPVTAAKKLKGGLQNNVFLIERGAHSFVLRRPSKHVRPGSNETMLREARVLAALRGSAVPHPALYAHCDDPGVIGACFYLMEPLEGFAPSQQLPGSYATDAAWPWPERRLTYENALPARALMVAGRYLDEPRMVDQGLRVLDWLIEIQTAPDGHFAPIGNGWWPRDGDRSQFDQQPIEATAMILAAEDALAETGDDRDRAAMERAYAWFLGGNDLGVAIADPARGAGADGLTPEGINVNEGAESTLMWLMALEHIRILRGGSSTSRSNLGRRSVSHTPSGRGARGAASEHRVPVTAA